MPAKVMTTSALSRLHASTTLSERSKLPDCAGIEHQQPDRGGTFPHLGIVEAGYVHLARVEKPVSQLRCTTVFSLACPALDFMHTTRFSMMIASLDHVSGHLLPR